MCKICTEKRKALDLEQEKKWNEYQAFRKEMEAEIDKHRGDLKFKEETMAKVDKRWNERIDFKKSLWHKWMEIMETCPARQKR